MKPLQKGLKTKKVATTSLNMKDLTISLKDRNEILYLTKVYEHDGKKYLLGFYSHSPWGHVRDQEQGWVLVDYETLKVCEEVATRSDGRSTSEFADWYKNLKEMYGKSSYLVNELGDRPWKITEVDK